MKFPPLYVIAGGAAIAALLYIKTKGANDAGQQIGAGAVDLANGVLGGTVTGIGEIVGVPATNQTECEKCKASGDKWCASFACPAKDFLKFLFS